ncbi:serine protease [Salipaludibacillus keqinensis]|uniref:Serine protease n=1 Tax=Salipaludibacillus keqinensis TaxID=2045207 RepID=A0A323TJK3_9BACI|nr:trypsin-like peptidase domain-containing protein [Salipaludibacillus keqinensis]PYZ95058.1 serine protease [Salipaludibacillus keqinensis]
MTLNSSVLEGDPINDSRDEEENENNQNTDNDHTFKEKEELFFDGERYYTKEEFFHPEEEEQEIKKPKKKRRGLKIGIASLLTIALLSNVFAMWPRLFNLPAIDFIATSQELSNNEEVQLYKESIVVVRAGNSKGTGFYISDDGYIMTNEHVLNNDPQPTVTFQNGESYRAEVIESNEDIDIAILQIDIQDTDHSPPILEFEETWDETMRVYVIGNPLFFNYIANEGTLIGTTTTQSREEPVIMLDAPIYQGSSGSPVINQDGNVIGVVYATTRVDHDGSRTKVGLAISVDDFKQYVDLED